jgi:hypothetical protein
MYEILLSIHAPKIRQVCPSGIILMFSLITHYHLAIYSSRLVTLHHRQFSSAEGQYYCFRFIKHCIQASDRQTLPIRGLNAVKSISI